MGDLDAGLGLFNEAPLDFQLDHLLEEHLTMANALLFFISPLDLHEDLQQLRLSFEGIVFEFERFLLRVLLL